MRNAVVCVVAEASPPRPQSLQGEPWSRASAGLCVCKSPPRPPRSYCTRHIKSNVTEVTGWRLCVGYAGHGPNYVPKMREAATTLRNLNLNEIHFSSAVAPRQQSNLHLSATL